LKAGGAEPEGIHAKGLLLQAQKGLPNDFVGTDLHGEGNRTSSRTVATLVTGKQVLPADQLNLLRKFIVNSMSRQFDFHYGSPEDEISL
jgi:hypothetical protein